MLNNKRKCVIHEIRLIRAIAVPCVGVVPGPRPVVTALGWALDAIGLTIKVSFKSANT